MSSPCAQSATGRAQAVRFGCWMPGRQIPVALVDKSSCGRQPSLSASQWGEVCGHGRRRIGCLGLCSTRLSINHAVRDRSALTESSNVIFRPGESKWTLKC